MRIKLSSTGNRVSKSDNQSVSSWRQKCIGIHFVLHSFYILLQRLWFAVAGMSERRDADGVVLIIMTWVLHVRRCRLSSRTEWIVSIDSVSKTESGMRIAFAARREREMQLE